MNVDIMRRYVADCVRHSRCKDKETECLVLFFCSAIQQLNYKISLMWLVDASTGIHISSMK